MSEAVVNGVRTSYETVGDGPPVLFIHGGFGGPGSTVLPQVRQIASVLEPCGVQTITYDRRCAGSTDYVLDAYTVEDLAADARALLAHLGIDRSIVIGDSMGGMVAQAYALAYPEHVSALCLMETGADLMSETTFGKSGRELVERARADGDRSVFDARKDALRNPPAGGGFIQASTPERQRMMEERRTAMVRALADVSDDDLFRYSSGELRNYAAFIGYDFTSRLRELEMPVCVIHGNADTTVPFSYGELLHAGIAQSEFHEIEGATHGVLMWEQTQEALRDWIGRVTR